MGLGFNIYCDESCHLPRDHMPAMVLGAVKVPVHKSAEVALRLREIKVDHGLSAGTELKWGKVSPGHLAAYRAVVDYFFDDDDLAFRAVVAHRANLNHDRFGQTHDDWYYKMYYQLLSNLISSDHEYRVYLDIKDTRGGPKTEHLRNVLRNGMYDFSGVALTRLQTVRSHEVQALQLADILIGALSYRVRGLTSSPAKLELIARIGERSRRNLDRSTPPREPKFNVFHWRGSAG